MVLLFAFEQLPFTQIQLRRWRQRYEVLAWQRLVDRKVPAASNILIATGYGCEVCAEELIDEKERVGWRKTIFLGKIRLNREFGGEKGGEIV